MEPGLYVVSMNVNASYAFSTIPGGATPSLLTLVAGSVTDSPTSAFPEFVYYNAIQNQPNGYFWLDVDFALSY